MLSRRRVDPAQARARLLALRDGHDPLVSLDGRGSADPSMGEGHDAGRVGVDRIGRLLPTHSALRPVVVSIGLTALVMWVLTHMGTMAPTSVVQMSPGTPLPAVSAGSGGISSSSVPGVATLAAAASSVPRTIVVQVIGEVHEPGLVTLPDGARVADAIEAAGGLISRRSSGGLNVARRLVDGEQIVVSHADPTSTPVAQVVGPSTSIPGVGAPIDLNSADVAALDGLPGVGPVMAARIIAWRTQHGRFTSVDQLRDVSGIGQRTFERLRPFVRI